MTHRDPNYRKPPRDKQFTKGTSGNPRGRPKGKRNLATVLDEVLNEAVVIVEDGEQRTVCKMEAAIRSLVQGAMTGNIHASRVLWTLTASAEDSTTADDSEQAKRDQKVIEDLIRQFNQGAGER